MRMRLCGRPGIRACSGARTERRHPHVCPRAAHHCDHAVPGQLADFPGVRLKRGDHRRVTGGLRDLSDHLGIPIPHTLFEIGNSIEKKNHHHGPEEQR